MATTFQVAKNRAKSALAADITSAVTSLTVTAGEGAKFPSTYPFPITIEDEILKCTNRSTDTLTVERAQEGTTAAAHFAGKFVHLRITAKFASDLHTAVNAIENKTAFESCKVYRTTSQSIPDSTATVINFDNEEWDTDDIHDNATNPSRLTCKVAGTYLVSGGVQWEANTTGRRLLAILQNGATVVIQIEATVSAANQWGGAIVIGIIPMAVNDYVELRAYQTSGGALSTHATGDGVNFAMHRLVS